MSNNTLNALPLHYHLVQGGTAVSYLLLRCGITSLDEWSPKLRGKALVSYLNFVVAFSRLFVCPQNLNTEN
jgi:hypothetical protein